MILPPESERRLLGIARDALIAGVEDGPWVSPDVGELDPALARQGASFVSLYVADMLRGCIGTLEPYRPLAADVAANAYGAGFRDPRFPALIAAELAGVEISVTVVGTARPLAVASEAELLDTLRPGVDGLTLEMGAARATFLPTVWEQEPEPRAFLEQLRLKAGLAPDFWSPALRFSRYECHTFTESQYERDPDADHGTG